MKRLLLTSMVILLTASVASAQVGSVGLFSDTGGASCNFVEVGGLLEQIFAVHVETGGATACEWAAPEPACYAGSFLSDGAIFGVTVGGSQTGVSIGYGMCLGAPIHCLTLNIFNVVGATTPPCCNWKVIAHPINGLNMVTCAPEIKMPMDPGGTVIINPDGSCMCDVAAHISTWGAIKDMYR